VNKPLRDIARALGVDGILEGSVSRSGNRVHINLQLIYAPTDAHLWAQSYDRDTSAVLSLSEEL
jgi:TolB-like protein